MLFSKRARYVTKSNFGSFRPEASRSGELTSTDERVVRRDAGRDARETSIGAEPERDNSNVTVTRVTSGPTFAVAVSSAIPPEERATVTDGTDFRDPCAAVAGAT